MTEKKITTNELGVFKDIALSQIQRILGLGDRDENSRTFGCFDRYFWHYRLLDMPNARFQEVAFILSLLYKNDFEGNLYFENKKVLIWARSAINFWTCIQNQDGSQNEIYPFERSFCATAFSTLSVSQAALILRNEIKVNDWANNFFRAGKWLSENNNKEVSNQMAASVLALYCLYLLLGEKKFLIASQERLKVILKSQNEEGYFSEYGGFDLGYLSLTVSCLGQYYKNTKDPVLFAALKRSLDFLEKRVEEDGSFNYSDTSRQTQFLYPYGFRIFDSIILQRILKCLKDRKILNPSWMDDRYAIGLTLDYILTYLEAT